jgi:cyclin B
MERQNDKMDIENNNQNTQNINPNINISSMEGDLKSNSQEFNKNTNKFQTSSSELNSSLATNYSNNANSVLDQSINSLNKSNISSDKLKFEPIKINNEYLYNLEYFDEMYTNLLLDQKNAKVNIDKYYMNKQNDINAQMRAILVDWLIEIHYRFNFKRKTLFQTIFIIDLFLSKIIIQKDKFQLLGVACLLISCKENEIFYPRLQDFVNISNNAYSKDELIKMENYVLKILNFEILCPTSEEFYNIISKTFNFSKAQHHLGEYFLDSSLIDYKNLKYNFSTIAVACAYIVMKFYKMNGYKDLYSYKMIIGDESHKDIKECAKDLCFLVKHLSKSSLRATKDKYSLEEYDNVASICESK